MKPTIVFLGLTLSLSAHADFTGKVVHVTDGDTITVLRESERLRVRIAGIDAPENKQPFGNVAKKLMAFMVAGKEVRVEEGARDRDGQIIGRVWVADTDCRQSGCPKTTDAGLALLAHGLAWHSRQNVVALGNAERDPYGSAEKRAQNARAGLWRDTRPVPPWEWKGQY